MDKQHHPPPGDTLEDSMSEAKLQAGRELDLLVARKVMGLTVHRHHGHPKCEVCGLNYAYFDSIEPPAHYSTNIACAWMVVCKLVGDGRVVIVKGDGLWGGDHNPAWTVLIDNQERTDAATASLAICLAALKAAK